MTRSNQNSQKKAVQFGAGNIGRGFIGQVLSQAGYRLTFVDVVDPLVRQINERGRYTLIEIDASGQKEVTVENVEAINASNESAVIQAIVEADIIITAVGPGVLPIIAKVIAKGLQQRAQVNPATPLNIIACENLIHNSHILRDHVTNHLPDTYRAYVERNVGFPNCVIDRVVTAPSDTVRQADPLAVVAEGQGIWIVDRYAVAGELPVIAGLQFTENLEAYVEQKIFTLNTAHAIAAYLGYLKGYQYIHEALHDPEIYRTVLGSVWEFGAVLTKRHNLDPVAQQQYAAQVLKRFENSSIPDPIERVARDPKRKLAPTDRLVKPALLALEAGVTPNHLATGIAAALLYDAPTDAQAVELGQALRTQGLEAVLQEVCQLPPDSALTALIKSKMSKAVRAAVFA
ncbi:MAG: mannitol-1-phosphate 5-dehydrogenase [Chloroflexi bacterium]|nr:MAG: mannitol-1-phosphate 5-dehydrogenase [Chloroflexota bacterium]